ncbi:MAG: DUF4167 domain-containing protein [Hyphomicrobium sp.]
MDLMRQGQQNRRGRGRSNNNNNNNNHQHKHRGNQNPLTRSFESTGPDTKIRGTPAHIAEKYMTLARDAQSSGDPVLAENYLQHAEHYNRIIMAYREQLQQSGDYNGAPPPAIARFRPGPQDPMGDDFGEGEGDEFSGDGQGQPSVRADDPQPSIPVVEGSRPEGGRPDGGRDGQRFEERGTRYDGQRPRYQNYNSNNSHGQGQHRDRSGDRQADRPSDRQPGGDRGFMNERRDRYDRNDRSPDRQDRNERPEPRAERPEPRSEPRFEARQPVVEPVAEPAPPQPRRSPRAAATTPLAHEQPEFLRRPVRRPRREDDAATAAPVPTPTGDEPARE